QAPEVPFGVETKVDPAVVAKLQRLMGDQPELANALRQLLGEIRRKDLLRASRLVLALIVEDLSLGDDLSDGERLARETAHGELSPGDERLEHHLVVETKGFRQRGFEIGGLSDHGEADGGALLA